MGMLRLRTSNSPQLISPSERLQHGIGSACSLCTGRQALVNVCTVIGQVLNESLLHWAYVEEENTVLLLREKE